MSAGGELSGYLTPFSPSLFLPIPHSSVVVDTASHYSSLGFSSLLLRVDLQLKNRRSMNENNKQSDNLLEGTNKILSRVRNVCNHHSCTVQVYSPSLSQREKRGRGGRGLEANSVDGRGPTCLGRDDAPSLSLFPPRPHPPPAHSEGRRGERVTQENAAARPPPPPLPPKRAGSMTTTLTLPPSLAPKVNPKNFLRGRKEEEVNSLSGLHTAPPLSLWLRATEVGIACESTRITGSAGEAGKAGG